MNSSMVRNPPPTRTTMRRPLTYDLILLYLYIDTLRSKEIDALALSQEHHLQSLAVREVVQEFSQLAINRVILHWHVHLHLLTKLDDLVLVLLHFIFFLLKRGQQRLGGTVRFICLLLLLYQVVSSDLQITLQFLLLS